MSSQPNPSPSRSAHGAGALAAGKGTILAVRSAGGGFPELVEWCWDGGAVPGEEESFILCGLTLKIQGTISNAVERLGKYRDNRVRLEEKAPSCGSGTGL